VSESNGYDIFVFDYIGDGDQRGFIFTSHFDTMDKAVQYIGEQLSPEAYYILRPGPQPVDAGVLEVLRRLASRVKILECELERLGDRR